MSPLTNTNNKQDTSPYKKITQKRHESLQIQVTQKRRHESLQIQITQKRHEPPTNTNNTNATGAPIQIPITQMRHEPLYKYK